MKLQGIKDIAKQKGVSLGKMNKRDSIRAIQASEGNGPCFGNGRAGECGQADCLWREDCD